MSAESPSPDTERDPEAIELLLQRYIDGELRVSERRDLESRLAESMDLRRQLEELRRFRGFFQSDAEQRPAPLGLDFADRIWAKLQAEHLGEGGGRQKAPVRHDGFPRLETLRAWTLIAASLVVLLGAALLFLRPGEPGQMTAAQNPRRSEARKLLEKLDDQAERRDRAEKERKEAARRGKRAGAAADEYR